MRAESVDTGAIYERTRRLLLEAIAAASEDQLRMRVQATPDWTVRDVLAHVTGLATDLKAQRFPEPSDVGGTVWANPATSTT